MTTTQTLIEATPLSPAASANRLHDYHQRCGIFGVKGLADLRHYPAEPIGRPGYCAECGQHASHLILGWTIGSQTVAIPVCKRHCHGSETLEANAPCIRCGTVKTQHPNAGVGSCAGYR